MRTVLLFGDAPNQMALANKICLVNDVLAIVLVQKINTQKKSFVSLVDKILVKLIIPEISNSWKAMLAFYNRIFQNWPQIPKFYVNDINDDKALDFIKNYKPDLIVVSGTNLLNKKTLKELEPSIGIINLHTGLSPYVKGGPNCTNWCLANGDYHLIGNTVMWINAGIDSGNIVASEFTEFTKLKNISDLHIQVMEHAHDLLLRCINSVKTNLKTTPNIPQKEISDGNLFLTKDWTFSKKLAFKKNIDWFLENYNSDDVRINKEKVKTVRL